ncbi:MAG: patatin-like phospholipase family protein [Spirochaetia bacterium]|jgi:NTE family protein|nr:patatin-like phospholipase family protein [Spirochaetales bacterium]MDX9783947.1 patatin-like phospholipase family protein [Spirochaetia bacterium]
MPQYKNLVFKGGGVRGAAYLGALKYLYENRLMRTVERVAGSSVGAITAAVLALNFKDFTELKAIADSLDYRRVPAEGDLKNEDEGLVGKRLAARLQTHGLFKNLQCSIRLVQEKGWYSSDYMYQWLRSVIAARFSTAKEAYTFRDFRDSSIHRDTRSFLDLYVTGTDISNRKSRVFSFDTTPDMEVALAVRISMSIPLFFEAIPFEYPGTQGSQYFADGGLMWNYPIELFDQAKYGRRMMQQVNAESLGFFLYESPQTIRHKEIKGLVDYLGALFETLNEVQDQLVPFREKNMGRTVFIDDQGVPMTQFEIEVGDETYSKLFDSGYRATREFFSNQSSWDVFVHRLQSRLGWGRDRMESGEAP